MTNKQRSFVMGATAGGVAGAASGWYAASMATSLGQGVGIAILIGVGAGAFVAMLFALGRADR